MDLADDKLGDGLATERFEITRRLGADGMAVVYEAYDRQEQAMVAIKALRRTDARARARFAREFDALAAFDHPNLIRLGEFFTDDERCFFTMELIEGSDFLSYVCPVSAPEVQDGRAVFDETRLRCSLGQLALGLDAI